MKNYYLHRDGENHGPYEESQLRQLIASKQIGSDELICEEGGSDWVTASGLATPTPPQPAVVPAPAQSTANTLQQQPKKGMHGCLKVLLVGAGALVMLTIIGYYFWSKDNALRQYGIAQIEATSQSEDEKLTYLAIAEHYHLKAANSGTRVTKRSSARPNKEDYWEVLKSYIIKDLREIPTTPAFDEIAGNTYLYLDSDADCTYLLKLSSNGSYVKTKHYDKDLKSPSETENGIWEASSAGFVWQPVGGKKVTQKIIRMGNNSFILKLSSESANYWKLDRVH